MTKKIFFYMLFVAIFIYSCDKDDNPPVITFNSDKISDIFGGDLISVNGNISADNDISAFWFHQRLNEKGNLDEQIGGRLTIDADGSFSIPIEVEKTSIGVKVIAEDSKGYRSVKILPLILGEDVLIIAFEGEGMIESIESGEEFNVKGTVTSSTSITSLTYTVIKGKLEEPSVTIDITDPSFTTFDIPFTARTGMTGIRINAKNRGMLTSEKTFEIKHIIAMGPVITLDQESIVIKPDSTFTITGQIISEKEISSVTYTVMRESGADEPKAVVLNDNKFSIDIIADGKITSVVVNAKDNENVEGEETLPVKVLFPERIETATMIHYKNIILDDKTSRQRSYFSFDVSPYVLNAEQAFLNYDKVQLMYTNLFISGQSYSGPAILTPNVSQGGTVNAKILTTNPDWPVTSWGAFNVGRLQAIGKESTLISQTGKSFDELDELTAEEWIELDKFLYNNGSIGSSGIIRQITTINQNGVGWLFRIGWGGPTVPEFNRIAIAIVRSFGGTPSSQEGESTGAWLEIEIKMNKKPLK